MLAGLVPAGYVQAQPAIYPGDYSSWNVPPGAPPPPPIFSQPYPPPPAPPEPPLPEMTAYRTWARADYLLWFVSGSGPRFPLVTTDTKPGTALAGSLASPTAIPLFGDSGFHYGAFSGMRLLAGVWLDSADTLGVEVGGFLLERRSPTFSAASNAVGRPALYVPAFNVTLGHEDSLLIADPVKGFTGSVALSSPLRFWGTDLNGVYHVSQSENWDVVLIGGFRYLDLGDSFLLQNTTADLATGTVTSLADQFRARNQFYGGNLGVRINSTWGRFFGGLTLQTALGATHEMVTISGATISTAAPTFFAGGFFAQPSNIGHQTQSAFAVVPQAGLALGYHVTTRLTALVGYDFIYWSDVVRAGNQVDRNINLTQNPVLGTTSGALVGAARPAPEFNHSGFIAHGISLGLMWQY
jgi:hypothetical protein